MDSVSPGLDSVVDNISRIAEGVAISTAAAPELATLLCRYVLVGAHVQATATLIASGQGEEKALDVVAHLFDEAERLVAARVFVTGHRPETDA